MLASFTAAVRHLFIFVVSLLIAQAGFTMPSVSLCANMPCCVGRSVVDVGMERPCCCQAVDCTEVHPQQFVSGDKTKQTISDAALYRVSAFLAARYFLAVGPHSAESPPTTQERLARLSVLNI